MAGTVLWLVALGALSAVAAIVLRRMGALAGSTHELQHLQTEFARIDQRLAAIVDALVARLDDVRRGARDPAELAAELSAARAGLRGLAEDARAIKPPAPLASRAAQLVWELDRAVRAVDMASHGVETLAASRSRTLVGTEAQVALKRGTLGLRHARDAVGRVVTGVAGLSPAEVRLMPASAGAWPGGIPTPDLDEDLLTAAEEPPSV